MRAVVLVGVVALGATLAADYWRATPPDAYAEATFIGRASCIDCHAEEHQAWTGSHHDKAMDIASDETVLADFNNVSFEHLGLTSKFFRDADRFMVNTEGPDGQLQDFEVKYVFGVDPLQQYMVEFEDGRVQVLRISWNVEKQEWFYLAPPDVPNERLRPDDPLHWTGIGQNWNTTCAICHSTNLQLNYDVAKNEYHTTYSEIDVSCEECHGPASYHVELANRTSFFWDRQHGYGLAKLKGEDTKPQIEACAECHSRRSAVHASFRPGTPLLDAYEPALLQQGLYHADGQILDEVYVYGSFLQSKMHAKGVRCTDCHNPHSLEVKFEGNKMCSQCHEPAKYDTVAHHHHPQGTPSSQCVNCHMPARTYMAIDDRRDHSFRIPRPDLTVSVGTPNACADCHNKPEEDAEWAADAVREWYGPKRPDDPHWAPAIAAARSGAADAEGKLAALVDRPETPAIVRATAVELLAGAGTREGRTAIAKGRGDFDPLVRAAAVRSTDVSLAAEAIQTLAPMLQDPIRAVRVAAAMQLVGIPDEMLTPTQRDSLASGVEEYRARQNLIADHAAGHLNLAILARRTGDIRKSISELRTAIRIEPYLSGPRGELASLLTSLPEETRKEFDGLVQQLRQEEIDLLRRDTGFAPNAPALHYRLGLLLYQTGKLAEAETALRRAAEISDGSYQYWMTLALLQERRFAATDEPEHYKNAVKSLKKLEAIDPADRRAGQILTRMLESKKQRDGDKQPTE